MLNVSFNDIWLFEKITHIRYLQCNWRKLFVFLFVFLFLSGCSTEKNTFITRTYHNITAHYNVYFNGNESMKKAENSLQADYEYNYSQLLPVFLYDNESAVMSVSSHMERAMEKGAKLINLHSITVKPEKPKGKMTPKEKEFYEKNEYCNWVDDAYLMIGKAHFYQQSFGTAIYTFNYILREYKDHGIRYKASVWLARSYIKNEEFNEAKKRLAKIEREEEFELYLYMDAMYYSTCADMYIKEEAYNKAIDYLKDAIEYEKEKDKRLRYTYLLAQLYHETNQNNKAVETYERVIKMNPPYEMTFNAKINLASAFQVGSGKSTEIEEQLFDMLKDDKNIDFQDQIYFALGEIEYKKGNIDKALEYYQLSAAKSVSNNNQKALSYLSMANIYYNRRNYRQAQIYYDSTSAYLGQDYPDLDNVIDKATNLNELIQSLNVIEEQDSLQAMANMSEKERLNFIDKAIARYNKKEAERKARENQQRQDRMYYRSRFGASSGQQMTGGGSGGGKWYFYNPTSVGFGKSEFRAKWGNRKLEDNWRRKNKSSMAGDMFADEGETQEGAQQEEEKQLSPSSRDYYLQNVPTNDSMMEASHVKLQQALFSAGSIYKNRFKDYGQAINTFEDLVERYPKSKYTAMACYQLYEIGEITGDNILKNKYKNIILNRFPESIYAKVIKDPDYLDKLEAVRNEAEVFYEKVYDKYKNKLFADVMKDADQGKKKYPEDEEVQNKLSYLKVLSIGKTHDIRVFKDSLRAFVDMYPGTETAEDAQNIIAHLDDARPDVKEEEEEEIAMDIYETTDEQEHYFAVAAGSEVDINQMIFNIIAFNLDNYDSLNLEVSGENLGEKYQVVTAKKFKNRQQAMKYFMNITANKDVYDDFEDAQLNSFVISKKNFKTLFSDLIIDRYMKFFRNNYIKQPKE